MKILKGLEHSLLTRPFGLTGRHYLSLGVLLFFDLTAPGALLKEQELWDTAPKILGQTPLDAGFPKPQAEALVAGACCAPRGKSFSAAQVAVQAGSFRKKLFVFGDRYWESRVGVFNISKPVPFSSMPLTWENAFGGAKFPDNPKGKGLDMITRANGSKVLPLPNVELPGSEIGLVSDRPSPAGFGPLELNSPQRKRYQGTYDVKWQHARMPGLPDDFNPLFFNSAPLDQQLRERFFQGGEDIFVENMHPDMPVIRSRIPEFRVRCFVTRCRSTKKEQKLSFEQVEMRLETLWLFPTVLRGICIYRGVSEVRDEEAGDVEDVLIAHEPLADPPKSMTHYSKLRRTLLERKVPVDASPLEDFTRQSDAAMQRLRLLPKDLQAARDRAMGKAPRMPGSFQETHEGLNAMLGERLAHIGALESLAASLRNKLGPGVPIDTEQTFSTARRMVSDVRQRLSAAAGKVAARKKAFLDMRKQMGEQLRRQMSPEDLRKAGINPDDLLPEPLQPPWQKQGQAFVFACRKNLLGVGGAPLRPEGRLALDLLQRMGLSRHSLRRHWVGLHTETRRDVSTYWGRDPQEGPVCLLAGLVLPRFSGKDLSRVRVRPGLELQDFERADAEYLVPGSDDEPLFLPAPGPLADNAPLLVVPDELQAILAEQEAGDLCSILALASSKQPPGRDGSEALQSARKILVVLPAMANVTETMRRWNALPGGAEGLVLPKGKTLFAAYRSGVPLRQWILEALPPDVATAHGAGAFVLPKNGDKRKAAAKQKSISVPDAKGFAANLYKESHARFKAAFPDMQTQKLQLEKQVAERIRLAGRDPEMYMRQPCPHGSGSMGEQTARIMMEQAAAMGRFNLGKAGAAAQRTMLAEAEKARDIGARIEALQSWAANMRASGREKLARLKSGETPPEVRQALEAAGIAPEQMEPLDREEALRRIASGQGLARCNISNLDFSGLELRNIDLRQAICNNTNFSGANLEKADLSQAQLMEADCSDAVMLRANLENALCRKAVFKKTDLRQGRLKNIDFEEADCSGADFSEASLEMGALRKTLLTGARFLSCNAKMTVFNQCDATDGDFSGATLESCSLQNCVLDKACFAGACLPRTMFHGCKGEKLRFAKANLDDCRMAGGTRFSGADFKHVRMRKAFFRETMLRHAIFEGAVMEKCMFEACDMILAQLRGVSAKWCRFEKCDLEGAIMRGMNIFQGSLRKSRLVQTDLRGANLFAADLYKVVMERTLLDAANLKRTLLWQREDLIP